VRSPATRRRRNSAGHAAKQRNQRGEGKPETFNLLGFTHVCGTTRKTGRFIVKRQTIRKRFSAKLKALQAELWHRWCAPVVQVGRWLRSVVQGWLNYYAVPGNMDDSPTHLSLRSTRRA